MLLQIHPADDGSPATWAMIELQGEIERKDGGLEGEAFDVGMLSTSSSGNFTLTIGYHQLEGKPQKLKKPLLVLSKINDDTTTMAIDDDDAHNTEFKVVGVIREKFLFKTRPRAIISKPETK